MFHYSFQAAVNDGLEQMLVEVDFRNARPVDTVHLGEKCLYYPHMLKMRYLPYDKIQWAYLRAEENRMSMCCGKAFVDIWYLILYADGKQVAKIEFQKKETAKEALEVLAERAPGCLIGYNADTKAQWERICAGE